MALEMISELQEKPLAEVVEVEETEKEEDGSEKAL